MIEGLDSTWDQSHDSNGNDIPAKLHSFSNLGGTSSISSMVAHILYSVIFEP